jgi:hypothetical protein
MVGGHYSYGAAGALYTRQRNWKSGCGHSGENRLLRPTTLTRLLLRLAENVGL